jgi:hypothetical protein
MLKVIIGVNEVENITLMVTDELKNPPGTACMHTDNNNDVDDIIHMQHYYYGQSDIITIIILAGCCPSTYKVGSISA